MLLAACDVTLLRMTVPALPERKLVAALPALTEDHLLSDPAKCALAVGPETSGMRTIAVTDRNWLETLTATIFRLGAKKVVATPFQSCLPVSNDTAIATLEPDNAGVELVVSHNGYIHTVLLPNDSHPAEIAQTLRTLAHGASLQLFIPAEHIGDYQEIAGDDLSVEELRWEYWAQDVTQNRLNLLTAQGLDLPASNDWKRWRLPLALAASAILVNIAGLQIDWLNLRQERQALQASMQQAFSSTYPNEKVIVDPLAQMRQKLALAKNRAGQPNQDDFLALSAAFGEAWANAAPARQLPSAPGDLASIEYRDRQLILKWKKEISVSPADLQNALAARNLSITQTNGTWQIGSMK